MSPILPDRIEKVMFFYLVTSVPGLACVECYGPFLPVAAAKYISGIVLDFKYEDSFY